MIQRYLPGLSACLSCVTLSTALTVAPLTTLSAQAKQTDFLVVGPPDAKTDVGGGIFAVDAAKQTSKLLAGLPPALRRASMILADPSSTSSWYVGTSGPIKGVPGPVDFYKIVAINGRLIRSLKLNSENLTADTEIKAMALAGNKIVFGSDLRVGTLPTAGGKVTELFKFRRSSSNFPAIASDGRYLYTNISNNNGFRTGGGTVWRFDLQDIKKHVSLFSVDQFPTNIRGLSVDSQGHLLVVDKGNFAAAKLRQFDIPSGQKLHDVTLPFQSLRGASFGEMDPFDETVVVVGQGKSFRDQNYYCVTVSKWKKPTTFYGTAAHRLSAVAVRRTPGLVRRGFVCASKAIPQLLSAAGSTPNVGNTKYSVDLRGKAGTAAVFVLGAGNGLKPIPLVPTKCVLGVKPILVLSGVIPASGRLAVPLPVPAGAAGFHIDTQWAAFEPGTNALGLVTTQVGAIYVR